LTQINKLQPDISTIPTDLSGWKRHMGGPPLPPHRPESGFLTGLWGAPAWYTRVRAIQKFPRIQFSLPERYLTPTYSEGSLVAANVGTVTTCCYPKKFPEKKHRYAIPKNYL